MLDERVGDSVTVQVERAMKVVTWQPVFTEHQSHTIRALGEELKNPVTIIAGKSNLEERQLQGWIPPKADDLDVYYLPSKRWWKEGVALFKRYPDAIHLFSSLWGDWRFFLLLIEAQRRGVRTGLITEPYSEVSVGYLNDDMGLEIRIKARLRPLIYRMAGLLVASKFKAVFPISEQAVEQFIRIGVKNKCIFPFGYFVPAITKLIPPIVHNNSELQLVFIGSLIERKGIPLLIEMIQRCHRCNIKVHLDVYGPGDSSVFQGVEKISYKGVIPFGQAQSVMAAYDLLVLPSLHDGWGVVVNEALLQGIPVLVSDQVGTKTLVEKSGAGAVFECGNVEQMVHYIESLTLHPDLLNEWKSSAVSFRTKLTPDVAAKYMSSCLQDKMRNKPENPWYINS